jgi:hypothetical protein
MTIHITPARAPSPSQLAHASAVTPALLTSAQLAIQPGDFDPSGFAPGSFLDQVTAFVTTSPQQLTSAG